MRFICSCALLVAILSCSDGTLHAVLTFENGGLKAICRLEQMDRNGYNQYDKATFGIAYDTLTFVYANLKLTNTGDTVVSYDLNEFFLETRGKRSDSLHLDAIGSYILLRENLNPGETKNLQVYWVFETKIDDGDLKALNLVVRAEATTSRGNRRQ
jgi:hypothetical protein